MSDLKEIKQFVIDKRQESSGKPESYNRAKAALCRQILHKIAEIESRGKDIK